MRKCKVCGKPETEFESVSKFLLHCRLCKKEADRENKTIKTILTRSRSGAEVLDSESFAKEKEKFLNSLPMISKEFIEVPDVAEEPKIEHESDNSISIPLSICPKELGYLADDKLIKIMVIGRKQGDRFVIEETKYK